MCRAAARVRNMEQTEWNRRPSFVGSKGRQIFHKRVVFSRQCKSIVKQPMVNDNYITVQIGKKFVKALVDTGSAFSDQDYCGKK